MAPTTTRSNASVTAAGLSSGLDSLSVKAAAQRRRATIRGLPKPSAKAKANSNTNAGITTPKTNKQTRRIGKKAAPKKTVTFEDQNQAGGQTPQRLRDEAIHTPRRPAPVRTANNWLRGQFP